jgi:hypothetical protein
LEKNSAIWLNTLACPSPISSAATGTTHSNSHTALTRSARPTLGRRDRQFLAEQAVDRRDFLPPPRVRWRQIPAAAARAEIADHAGREDDDREGDVEKEDRDKGDRRERDHHPVAQRALSDADDGMDHDREHRGLQPKNTASTKPTLP